jgi:hypothetical protein
MLAGIGQVGHDSRLCFPLEAAATARSYLAQIVLGVGLLTGLLAVCFQRSPLNCSSAASMGGHMWGRRCQSALGMNE